MMRGEECVMVCRGLRQGTEVRIDRSWAQRQLSPLSPLNIMLSINDPLHSLELNGFNN